MKYNWKSKNEKGITLIALIITIVILIILAAVSLNAVFGDRLLEVATDGVGNYVSEQGNEENVFNDGDHYVKAATNKKPRFEVVEANENGVKATIKVMATDEDNEDLTYKLYIGIISDEEELVAIGEEKIVKQGQEITWEVDVTVGADYYYKVEVKDRYVTVNTGIRKIGKLIQEIALDKTELTLRIGYPVELRETIAQLTAKVTPSDAGNQTLEWTSSNNAVATVNESGKVVGLKAGTAIIKAKATDGSNKEATCTVKVETSYGLEVAYIVGDSELETELTNAGIRWKILYANQDYTYLIASDFVPRNEICIKPKNGRSPIYNSSNDISISLHQVWWEYNGSSDIADLPLKTLNSQYTYESSNTNMRAVAYLMDQEIWGSYANEDAVFAIGGPTIEIIMKSYSEKTGAINETGEYRYQTRANSTGYEKSRDYGATWETRFTLNVLSKDDSLYRGDRMSGSQETLEMWLASPDAEADNSIGVCGYLDLVNQSSYMSCCGIRPVVCLPSDTHIEVCDETK